MKPIISIVMCVYNRTEQLKQAIKSILNQTYQRWELIIVDDGSEEDLHSVIKGFDDERIFYTRLEQNSGVPVARNVGNAMARGDYVAIMDSDDIMFPQRLQVQLDTLTQNPEIDVVYSSAWVVCPDDAREPYIFEAREWDLYKMIYVENLCFHPTVMFKRKCLELAEYTETIKFGSDYVFLAELALRGCKFKKIYEPLIRYTRHNKSISREHKEEQTQLSRAGIQKILANLPLKEKQFFEGIELVKGLNDFEFAVTVIVPCYKNAEELELTLNGLAKQTCRDFEVIVVDDGTSDCSILEKVKKYYEGHNLNITYFWNPDRGYTLCNTRNAGLKLSYGEIIVFLDADVKPEREFIEKVINLHSSNTNLLAIHARMQMDTDGSLIEGEDRKVEEFQKEQWRLMAGGNISISSENAKIIGLFDTNFNLNWGFEDTDWVLRALQKSIDVEYIPDIVGYHVGHKTFKDAGRNRIYFRHKWAGKYGY